MPNVSNVDEFARQMKFVNNAVIPCTKPLAVFRTFELFTAGAIRVFSENINGANHTLLNLFL